MLYPNEDFDDCNNGFPPKFAICLEKNVKGKPYHYLLILPDYPQDFKEMAIIRYWLKQLFNCAYEKALFDEVVFNPEIINLLFCDDRTTLRQFLIDKPEIFSRSSTFRKIWEYSLNYFKIYERLEFNFDSFDSEDFYILFKILLNEGKKLPKVCLKFNKSEKDWFREQVFDPLVDVSFDDILK
ncbi:unnamed protein product [Meloidogyne enterolobii]|uniref:Uncharacterized protein n=1 Tax=Meloidogyne enterolobii TaxID=390850 RepID=A0ACB0YQ02_MELEN